MKEDLEPLLKIIEEKLDWGSGVSWQSDDFENLHHLIQEKTGVSLSSSTLRRIWGRVDYNHDPSTTTLNILSRFAGYESWRAFLKEKEDNDPAIINEPYIEPVSVKKKAIPWGKIIVIASVFMVIGLLFLFAFKKVPQSVKDFNYNFSSKPVTRGIPNSVVFTYDASGSPEDSIFIQQSWDARTLTSVSKGQHEHTSIYFEPGFYQAKLIAGRKVVKEHPLLIPTNGWLGVIANKPVPVYLDSSSFIYKDSIAVSIAEIQKKNIPLMPDPPRVKYFNVGNFDPVPVNDFSFSAEIKNEYKDGAAACQFATIILVTDDGPVLIPLSVKGCVSELNLYCIDHAVSGKTTDLSAFGVDFSAWSHVVCNSSGNKIQFYINEKLAYESLLPQNNVQIVGMSYLLQGTGAVKNINLHSKNALLFHAF